MLLKHSASFRDPYGSVFLDSTNHRIIRSVNTIGIQEYRTVRSSSFIRSLIDEKALLNEREIDDPSLKKKLNTELLLEHPRLDFISYPYEWSFSALKKAALLHLSIQQRALEHNIILRDASAYNIQFIGTHPIFIDHLSFGVYQKGQLWLAQQQFLEQFLFPLLIFAHAGIPFHDLYRSNIHGIETSLCKKLLPNRSKFRARTFLYVILPDLLQGMINPSFIQKSFHQNNPILPKRAYLKNLERLLDWIDSLQIKQKNNKIWSQYTVLDSYSPTAKQSKESFVFHFIQSIKPNMVYDFGCNKGHFASLIIQAGAQKVIGFESCPYTVEKAFTFADNQQSAFTPLFLRLENPSPNQGAFELEHTGLSRRAKPDCLIALAILHHLVITAKLPLEKICDYFTSMAPKGLIEFIPLDDEQCQKLVQWEPRTFEEYRLETMTRYLEQQGYKITLHPIDDSKRVIIEFS